MKLYLLSLIFICLLTVNCKGQVTNKTETIPPTVFAQKIKATSNALILDVRTPAEFSNQHIDNAVNADWNGDDFTIKVQKFDKTKPIFIYCMSGGRSKKAAAKLEELGFSKIYDLEGGILKWNSAGMDIPSDKIIGVSSKEYEELLLPDKKVLVNFYAEWCAPCKKMAPYIKKMQDEMTDKVRIVRLNADENKTILKELKIDELPTLILYENKEIKWKHSGFISEEDLKKQLK
ncbi:thioredoxin domain-containing protein [Flavobacterium luteum]|uniref:Thioredoxin fold domain-containing protein n=1 Tax=Flavobacterium luteum TaxID=2026654 RepID=A0A7J5AC08_9FLAO|nr:thioredoxin domain-containing protein [Flavobacterium luteum]KAB1155065.1 thioredoxin fold domain-containing protein [Flavobacterium luteum]